MNLRKIFIAAGIIALIAAFILLKNNNSSHDSNTLIVGTATGYAPFVSINHNGDYEGFDIDIAHALAKQMNKTLIIKDLGSMAPLFTALDQGTIDVIIWGMSITQERLTKVAMVNYYGDTTQAYSLIFWDTLPTGVTGIADMHGKTVAVEPTSVQETFLNQYPTINKLPTEKIDDALLHIQYGKADAALVEPAIAHKFQRIYPTIKIVNIPLNPEDQVHGIGIVLKKNNNALIQEVDLAVAQLKAMGTIKKFANAWNIPS